MDDVTTHVAEPVRVAEDLADLFALAVDNPAPAIRGTLSQVVQRHREGATSLKLSDAAQVLNVTVPTVRNWVDKGVLDETSTDGVRHVSAVSVGWALSVLRRARETGDTRARLAVARDALADRALLDRAHEIAKTVDAEDLVTFGPDELDALRNA